MIICYGVAIVDQIYFFSHYLSKWADVVSSQIETAPFFVYYPIFKVQTG
jgi:hypothetical protein